MPKAPPYDLSLDELVVPLSYVTDIGAEKKSGKEAKKAKKQGVKMSQEEDTEWPMARVRSTFINFFKDKHEHTFWPSSPCVPHDDPTLLFANAGMNQYKPLFLGTCDPNLEMSKLKRAVNSQKCIRAGGKHNDLDDVGKDTYHHTFFEMLGNWSFGDYFKKEAIDMAWRCLVEEFKLNPDNLYATYFGGDESTPCDDEARELWLQYLPPERVLPFDAKDNFWEMGATGPCGPCTEIHYDRIGGRDASKLVNADLPDVIEIWNNVFIQFNREADRSLRPLPAQHIDTGMGFERLTSILQNKQSNYDTDIFMPIFAEISRVTGARPYAGKLGAEDVGFVDMAYRVVADHIRTLSFAIADGAVPSNDGRGYVLRRILRRAVRFGRQNLGADLGFFAKLVPTLVNHMGDAFPELKTQEKHITAVIQEEEQSFSRTLDKGLQKFKELADKAGEDKVFSGVDAHFLYTSMGFPVDLTELMAEEHGLTVNRNEFEAKMKEEQEMSQAAHQAKMAGSSGKDMRFLAEQTSHLSNNGVVPTNDDAKYVWNEDLQDCTALALFIGRNETEDKVGFVDKITSDNGAVGIVLDKTSFYGEAGGQIYDTGVIKASDGSASIRVDNVQIYGQYILHVGEVLEGTVKLNDKVTCAVDYVRRSPIASNHTMTHVLNFALRDVLVRKAPKSDDGTTPSIDQKGSLVDEKKLRFDFSFNRPLTTEELAAVEKICADNIQTGFPVLDMVAPLEEARQISSLRAVFGEAYPDPVRVVAIAKSPIAEMLANPQEASWMDSSVEFCGGTHIKNTSEAEAFVLLNEEGIAKGIRRITAVTKADAKEAVAQAETFMAKLTAAGDLSEAKLDQEIKTMTVELNELSISAAAKNRMRDQLGNYSKRIVAWKKERGANLTTEVANALVEEAKNAGEGVTKVVCRYDFGIDGKMAKAITTAYAKEVKDKACLLVTADEGSDRFMVIAFAPQGCDVDCKAWVAACTEGTGGKGGGKKDSAQSTISGMGHIDAVMEKAKGV